MAEQDELNSRYRHRRAGRPSAGMDALEAEMTAFEQTYGGG